MCGERSNILRILSHTSCSDILIKISREEGKRFNEIREELGINQKTVNMRLKELTMFNLLKKKGPHYVTTEKGERAVELVQEILELQD